MVRRVIWEREGELTGYVRRLAGYGEEVQLGILSGLAWYSEEDWLATGSWEGGLTGNGFLNAKRVDLVDHLIL